MLSKRGSEPRLFAATKVKFGGVSLQITLVDVVPDLLCEMTHTSTQHLRPAHVTRRARSRARVTRARAAGQQASVHNKQVRHRALCATTRACASVDSLA